jgi:peptide/nickel transport system substrate-binding protein
LAEAGHPRGFEVRLDCTNDRYVNDASICQAIAANLSRVGITTQLNIDSKVRFLPRLLQGGSSF